MEENKEALRVFFQVRYQFIMSFDGPIDINHLAVDAAIRREEITDKDCFRKVLILCHWFIERLKQK